MALPGDPPPFPKIDEESIERVLDRVDALLARGRPPAAAPVPAPPPPDFPVLTEVVPEPPRPPTAQDLMLDQIENELRIELLGQMGPELERLIETRVHARLETAVEELMTRTRDQLVAEVRRAVREVLGQVIGDEVRRLQSDRSPQG